MRLPQSSRSFFSAHSAFLAILTTFFSVVTASARQSPQQLTAMPAGLRFGSVVLSQTENQEIVLANTGATSTTISGVSVNDSEFSVSAGNLPVTLSAGETIALTVSFCPSSDGHVTGQITITSNAENPSLSIGVEGTGVKADAVSASPSSLSFGPVAVGHTVTDAVVIRNPNSGSETIDSFQATGSGFTVSGPSTPLTLSAGQTLTLKVSFDPQSAGIDTGSVHLAGPNIMIPLTGTGTQAGQLTISPASLNFGNVDVGSSTTQPSSFTATGSAVTISSGGSNNSQFSISGVSFPLTIAAGQSVPFDVVFTPTQTGAESATLMFTDNATNQGSESLSGTGIQQQYSVNLSWNPSTSQVSGYNVYRGTKPGSYSKINSSLDPSTSYTDTTVSAGTTYYYAATSVTSSGQESGYCSPIQVSIP